MSSRDDCTIGWICVENDQFSLGRRFFDEEYEVFETYNNRFIFGRIGNHSAVLAFQPEIFQPGIDNATRLGEDLVKIFTNVRVCFLVGIGGGVPNQEHDIRLGDVLVGFSDGNTSSVIQFDYERTILDNTFTIREFLPPPPTLIQEAIHELQTKYKSEDQRLQSLIGRNIQFQLSSERVITPPDPSADRLYISSFAHAGDPYERCETACGDDESRLVPRSPRSKNAGTPTIHYGLIASGDSPIRDAEIRDQLAAEKNILCFETGASRFMIDFPCLVIRGICNYCDTHNSQIWSHYAAITALAYAKDLLVILEPNKVEAESKLSKVLYDGKRFDFPR
ncbi:nucleoside phosphorylase domain-containing protein [Annulohypoxylon moriforme]|nr:nucleoside phosphorylase domain-containing protein [Annulohypoxylon moriforme]